MKKYLWAFLAIFLLAGTSCKEQIDIEKGKADLAIKNVSIIDVKGGPTKTHMTVLIKGNRITKIDRSNKIRIKESTDQIDGTDKFLIPGLWDMHVHWYKEDYLPLFIANGVVGIRIMWGFPVHFEWREKSQKGELLCPRMIISSPIIDGPNPAFESSISLSNETEARQVIKKMKAQNYDFVKIYDDLPRDVFFAIADESKKLGIPFAGHISNDITLLEASNAGQKSIEHLISGSIYLSCSSLENEIRKEREERIQNNIPFNISTQTEEINRINESFDEKKAKSLFATFRENNTWFCPTIIVRKSNDFPEAMKLAYDSLFKYMPLNIRNSKRERINYLLERKDVDFMLKKRFQEQLDILYLMHQNGVKFIAGTDTYVPYCPPGFCLHGELELFVQAGFSPLEALQTATINAAIFNGSEDSLGTVEVDKIADLVLLEANPLDNIQNTQKINAVIYNGKPFRKSDLQNMLNDIETLANK